MYSYPMEALDPDESPTAVTKRGKKICHANFFKVGVCVGQHLVCSVKTSSRPTIKVYEPMDAGSKNKKKSGFAKMLVSGQDVLKPWKVSESLDVYLYSIGLHLSHSTGNLRPQRRNLDPFPAHQALRRLRARLRSHQPRHVRGAVAAGRGRHVARLRRAQGEHPADPHRAARERVPAVLQRLLLLREPQRVAVAARLEDHVGGQPAGLRHLQPLHPRLRAQLHRDQAHGDGHARAHPDGQERAHAALFDTRGTCLRGRFAAGSVDFTC